MRFSIALSSLLFSTAAITGSAQTSAVAATAAGNWNWSQVEKHHLAYVTHDDTQGRNKLLIQFVKNEYDLFSIQLSSPWTIEKADKGWMRQLGANKLPVEVSFDDEAPRSEEWGVVNHTDFDFIQGVIITQQKITSDKLFEKALKSKTLTVSFTDGSGQRVSSTFDLAQMKEQMAAHKAHVHHFGVMDVVGGLTAF